MGTWSHEILGNDTSAEVRENFLELYNLGFETSIVKNKVLENQKGNIHSDPTNVWLSFALICWECKCLDQALYLRIKDIVESGADIKLIKDLEASEDFIAKRKAELKKLLQKISAPKEKAKRRIKPPIEYEHHIKPGDVFTLNINSGTTVIILVVYSKHFKNKGEIQYINLKDSDSSKKGSLIIPSKYYWPQGRKWDEYINGGSGYSFEYKKEEKEDFEKCISVLQKADFVIQLDYSRLIFNLRWDNLDFGDSKQFIKLVKERWLEDTNINYRATTIKELTEHLNMKAPKDNK